MTRKRKVWSWLMVAGIWSWLMAAGIVALAAFVFVSGARAQGVTRICIAPPNAVGNSCQDVTAANPLPITGTISTSTTGFPTVQTTGNPISVTTGGVTGALPAGTVVVASNVGTTNAAYCKLGASATTSDQYIAPNGGWFSFTVGANTQLTCITSTSTTTVNMVGGSGLPTGTGGGSGGSGGAVTCAACATATNQTSGGQKTQIVDGSGNVIAATSNALNVNVANANSNGQATMASSSPVVIASNQSALSTTFTNTTIAVTNAGTFAAQVTSLPATPAGTNTIGTTGQLPYPVGSTPYTASATGTTGATTATLTGASSVTTYLCGFSIRANATAAATGNATVTGVITATINFTQWTAPNASGLGITEMIFTPCIPASGTNQSVAVVSAAPGTGGVVSVTAWGYKL